VRTPRVGHALGLTAIAAAGTLALSGSLPGHATASGVAESARWQPVTGLELGHGQALAEVAWASGRAWFVVGSEAKLIVTSARVRGSSLASFATSQVPANLGWYPIVLGSDVLYSATSTTTGVAPLLANGKVGRAGTADPDPLAQKLGAPKAAIRVGERTVWAIAGGESSGGINYKPTLWVCCDEAGEARDLTSLITQIVREPARGHVLGLDEQGRLWLAWYDGRGDNEVRIVQLDPTTLAPKTRKALVAPVPRVLQPGLSTEPLALVCTTTCRLVLTQAVSLSSGGFGTRLVTWAPGERTPTALELGLRRDPEGYYRHPALLEAGSRGGRLEVAYSYGSPDRGPTLNVAVGDARGRRLRTVGSIQQPARSRGVQMYAFHAGAFTPSAFVFGQMYSNYGTKSHVLATVVPLR
jgi:hypothetical protein